MVRAWFALLVFCTAFAVVGIMDVAPNHSFAAAQNALTPDETVANFYRWYLAYAAPDAQGNFNNPLADRAYRDSAYLAPELVAGMDALLDTGQLMADPFLCAQDIPADFETVLIAEDAQTAAVLLEERFGLSTHNITVLLGAGDAGWQIKAIACGDTFTPAGVVESFYRAYIAAGQYDEAAQTRHNPLLEGAYRTSGLLTPALSAEIDAIVAGGQLMADPLLCAQDLPQSVYALTAQEAGDRATVILQQYYQGNPEPRYIQVSLAQDEGWRIAEVSCQVEPEAMIAMAYRHYAQQMTRNIDLGLGWDLLRNPLRPLNLVLSQEVLDERAAAREAGGIDPLLCAQDIPAELTVAAQGDGSYLVSGLYPSGPETTTAYPLAVVRGVERMTGWQITDIACAGR